ncbi:MAG TPA: RNA polymerase sigma factor [Polyangiales bacterium]|nr:RNA polymerase sigma factor [Polyangiales bacterium]
MLSPASVEINAQTIDELSPALFRFAMRFVRRREEAEDLVQETWLSALRGAPTFEGRSSLRTWLNGIMRRRAADHYRKVRPTDTIDEDFDVGYFVSLAEQMDNTSAAQLAAQAIGELSLLEQTAVTLCDIQELEREEAAERMGITRGHLRVLLHRGRQKLVERLEAQGVRRDGN